jgi:hypothetical protein
LIWAGGLVAACNVYNTSLLDQTTPDTGGSSGKSNVGGTANGGVGNRGGVGGSGFAGAGAGTGGSLAGSGSSGTSATAGSSGVSGGAGSSGSNAGGSAAGNAGTGAGGVSGATAGNGGAGTAGNAGAQGGAAGKAGASGTGGAGGVSGSAGTSGSAGKGGSAGNAGSAGSAGSAGTTGTLVTIDDFEDMDSQLSLPGGGYWYTIDDMTAEGGAPKLTMVLLGTTNARSGSTAGLHFTAAGNTGYGAGFGADFVAVAAPPKKSIDASGYSAITFYAKVTGGVPHSVRFMVPDSLSDPAGGVCTTTGATQCNDHPGLPFTFTTSWAQYTANLDAMMTVGYGNPGTVRGITKAKVYGVNFTFKAPPAIDVDVLIDDMSFILQ